VRARRSGDRAPRSTFMGRFPQRRARLSPIRDRVTSHDTNGDPAAKTNDRRQHSPSRRAGTHQARQSLAAHHAEQRSSIERVADALTRGAASTPFLVFHVVWFATWILLNTGKLGIRPFDPFPFGLLTLIVSLEAIFLSIFVLMAQSRESKVAELREEVSLQVVLRMEEEVTKTLQLVAGLYTRLGQTVSEDPELREMLGPLDADKIERQLVEQIEEARRPGRRNSAKR